MGSEFFQIPSTSICWASFRFPRLDIAILFSGTLSYERIPSPEKGVLYVAIHQTYENQHGAGKCD